MSMEEYENSPNRTLGVIIGLVLLIVVGYLLSTRGCQPASELEKSEGDTGGAPPAETVPGEIEADAGVTETSAEALATLGVGLALDDPAALMARIAESLSTGDFSAAEQLIGAEGFTPEQAGRWKKLLGEAKLTLREDRAVEEVGELEINRRSRWALNLKGEDRRIYFDLVRGADGKWKVERVLVPEIETDEKIIPRAELVDSLGVADSFLQAALRQDFEAAKSFVSGSGVSDAKIAGLCILFEEGHYQMRKKHPLRGMFNRETTAAFLANVENVEGGAAAQFGLNLQRETAKAPWKVVEINLDQLLASYADKMAGGDVYYTPLVKNPNGGDTLVLYFDFDKKGLEPRSERQLEIVTGLLQLDAEKKIRISGHTDGFGTDDYNRGLSRSRAETVKAFLIKSGVPPKQIVTEALGKTQPRRPNTTRSGDDDPSGRRANRRTEIYLDF